MGLCWDEERRVRTARDAVRLFPGAEALVHWKCGKRQKTKNQTTVKHVFQKRRSISNIAVNNLQLYMRLPILACVRVHNHLLATAFCHNTRTIFGYLPILALLPSNRSQLVHFLRQRRRADLALTSKPPPETRNLRVISRPFWNLPRSRELGFLLLTGRTQGCK